MPILGSSNSVANEALMSKIWQMGLQLSDWVENVAKTRYEQFLFFHCFQKLSVVDASKWVSIE